MGKKEDTVMEEHAKAAWRVIGKSSIDRLSSARLIDWNIRTTRVNPKILEAKENAIHKYHENNIKMSVALAIALVLHKHVGPEKVEDIVNNILSNPSKYFQEIRTIRTLTYTTSKFGIKPAMMELENRQDVDAEQVLERAAAKLAAFLKDPKNSFIRRQIERRAKRFEQLT